MKKYIIGSLALLLLALVAFTLTSCDKWYDNWYWSRSRIKEVNFEIDGVELQAYRELNIVSTSLTFLFFQTFKEDNTFEIEMEKISLKGRYWSIPMATEYYGLDSEILKRIPLTSARFKIELNDNCFPQKGENLRYNHNGKTVLITAELYDYLRYINSPHIKEYRTTINDGYFDFKRIKNKRSEFEGIFYLNMDVEVVSVNDEILDKLTLEIYNGQFADVIKK